jgi:hypothetical protein
MRPNDPGERGALASAAPLCHRTSSGEFDA